MTQSAPRYLARLEVVDAEGFGVGLGSCIHDSGWVGIVSVWLRQYLFFSGWFLF